MSIQVAWIQSCSLCIMIQMLFLRKLMIDIFKLLFQDNENEVPSPNSEALPSFPNSMSAKFSSH